MILSKQRTLSSQNLGGFNFDATKRNVNNYFLTLENLQWEWMKLHAQRGLTTKYDFTTEYKKQSYINIGKDIFKIVTRELTEEKLKEYISSYHWAISILSDEEQLYIMEYFIERKYENEIVDLLGFNNSDSNEFKQLKRSAIYKFADFLNLLATKKIERVKNG